MSEETWVTDADLLAARQRFAERIPDFQPPLAYSVARDDRGLLTFGHINELGGSHRLPGVVLATFCGYSNQTGVYPLGRAEFSQATEALAPAEAATQWDHPNLWSWRRLLDDANEDSTFLAFYLRYLDDEEVDERDSLFRSRFH